MRRCKVKEIKMDLFPHQEKLLGVLGEHDQYAIFWSMRVMKTFPVLLHMTNLLMAGKATSALVIAPKSALGAWKRDINKTMGKRRAACSTITLVNYERVWRSKEYDRQFDIVILDESHKIAHRQSKQSKFCMKYATRSIYRYILTGTPLGQGRLEDLYTQMEFLFPGFFGSYKAFEERYLITKQLPGTFVKIVLGYKNKDELIARIKEVASTLTLDDIADMPTDPPDNIVICPRTNMFIQGGIRHGYVKEYDMIIDNPMTKRMKLREVASGFIIDNEGVTHVISDTKRFAFGELLDEIGNEKVVVFCEFKQSVKDVTKELVKRQISYVVLDGEQNDKEIWRWFQNNEHVKAIVCQYATASQGIDLYTARQLIFYEPSVSTTLTDQARARIKTGVNPRPCLYHWLIAKDTIELKILRQLEKHQDFTVNCLSEWEWASMDNDEDL